MPVPDGTELTPSSAQLQAYPNRSLGRLIFLLGLLAAVVALGGYFAWPTIREDYNFRAAQTAARERDFAKARGLLLANLARRPRSAGEHFLLARIARQSAAFDEAGEQLDRCQELEGATARIGLERVLLQVQEGGVTYQAEARLGDYLKQDHADAEQILEALSLGCFTNYRYGTAVTYLTNWLERRPNLAQPYIWRSLAYERLVEYASARNDARHAVALIPESFEARLRLAQTLMLTTEFLEAAAVFRQLYQERPGDATTAMDYAQAMLKLGVPDEAKEATNILDKLAARFPDEPGVLMERGRLALQSGQPEAAEKWLRRAAARAPANYQINYTLLQALQLQGKKAEAEKVQATVKRLSADGIRFNELNDQLKQHPYDLKIRCDIAKLYEDEGSDKDAVEWLRSALKFDPAYPLANQLLAEYYERSGQPALAAPYRRYASGNDPLIQP
jgi:predicted Zn-dependent protease